MTAADRHAALIVLNVAADAYGMSPDEESCSRCGCASPAAEPDECAAPDCPLEGRGRE